MISLKERGAKGENSIVMHFYSKNIAFIQTNRAFNY